MLTHTFTTPLSHLNIHTNISTPPRPRAHPHPHPPTNIKTSHPHPHAHAHAPTLIPQPEKTHMRAPRHQCQARGWCPAATRVKSKRCVCVCVVRCLIPDQDSSQISAATRVLRLAKTLSLTRIRVESVQQARSFEVCQIARRAPRCQFSVKQCCGQRPLRLSALKAHSKPDKEKTKPMAGRQE